jgi:hypothetical protein
MHTKVSGLALATGALVFAFALSAVVDEMKGPKTPLDLAKERTGSLLQTLRDASFAPAASAAVFSFDVTPARIQ